ncbi:glycosyltransferase, partial [Rhizobium ruizarguesonis]
LGSGKTIIASRVGGIPEVLGADSAALVEPGNSDDLARVMAETLSTPDWHSRTMPKPEVVKAVFSSAVMARYVLKYLRGGGHCLVGSGIDQLVVQ